MKIDYHVFFLFKENPEELVNYHTSVMKLERWEHTVDRNSKYDGFGVILGFNMYVNIFTHIGIWSLDCGIRVGDTDPETCYYTDEQMLNGMETNGFV